MSVYRRVLPVPIDLANYTGLDISPAQCCYITGESYPEVLKQCRIGTYESFKLGAGTRRIVLASVMRRRAEAIALGPQFSVRPVTGKRPVGRPKMRVEEQRAPLEQTRKRRAPKPVRELEPV
jgi:hypothetical protein